MNAATPASDGRPERAHVVVLGAGVIGLTCAHVLQRRGYRVTIAARDLPEDVDSPAFASPWAGANWCSFASHSEVTQQEYDRVTFEVWSALGRRLPGDVISLLPFAQNGVDEAPWFARTVPDFRLEHYAQPTADGRTVQAMRASFRSHCINVPRYTQWLVAELRDPSGTVVPAAPFLDDVSAQAQAGSTSRRPVPVAFERLGGGVASLGALAARFPDAALLVNASGLGAAALEDVRDDNVHPIAGQVLVAQVERFKTAPQCVMGGVMVPPPPPPPQQQEQAPGAEPHAPSAAGASASASAEEKPPAFHKEPVSYVIPRARSGLVILGGSYDEGCSDTRVDAALSERILQDAVRICPELLLRPPSEYAGGADDEAKHIASIRADSTAWRQIKVVSAHVGLRPARKGGIRVEPDEVPVPVSESATEQAPRSVKVVHAYGIGPAGYQASWGVAQHVAQLVKQVLEPASAALPLDQAVGAPSTNMGTDAHAHVPASASGNATPSMSTSMSTSTSRSRSGSASSAARASSAGSDATRVAPAADVALPKQMVALPAYDEGRVAIHA